MIIDGTGGGRAGGGNRCITTAVVDIVVTIGLVATTKTTTATAADIDRNLAMWDEIRSRPNIFTHWHMFADVYIWRYRLLQLMLWLS